MVYELDSYINDEDNIPKELKKINKTILYWNPFFTKFDYFGNGWKAFENCEIKSCYITSNRRYLPIDEYDAIIFHGAEYNYKKHGKPKKRDPQQRYIFYTWESATNRFIDSHFWKDYYNWTMTYWRKSDIYMPYGDIIRNETNYTMPDIDFVKKKLRTAAWFVSNCKAKNKRKQYVNNIQQSIDVDVYGKCGTKVCPRSKQDKCYEMLEENYLYYFSFENTLCEDYITEKLYLVLNYNVVPVVYGLANYEELAPPHSVIDSAKFKNIDDLVKYLKYLKDNPKEYLKYFEWKKDYVVYNKFANEAICTLCKKLHYDKEVTSYENINEWWKGNCIDHTNLKVPT